MRTVIRQNGESQDGGNRKMDVSSSLFCLFTDDLNLESNYWSEKKQTEYLQLGNIFQLVPFFKISLESITNFE